MSISSLQGNPLELKPVFLLLKRDQRDAFQAALKKLVSHFKRIAPVEAAERKLSNKQILLKMKSLLTHLNCVCAASGPESEFQAHFWGQYIGFKASDDDRKVIADFPRMAELMRRIVADSITSESYKIRPLASDRMCTIAMQAAQLLRKFEIEPTTTVNGAWVVLTKYILHHGRGRDATAANICNYLKKVKGYF